MRFSLWNPLALLASLTYVASGAAGQILRSSSLNTCQVNPSFSASLFNVVYAPKNGSATIAIGAVSTVQGNVTFNVEASAYGYTFLKRAIDPCNVQGLGGFCPMVPGNMNLEFKLNVGTGATSQIPGIAYNIPDLDATVRVVITKVDTGENVSCLEADVSNGKTVNLVSVKWATAIVAGLALTASAVFSGLGHSNTATHVASNALSLLGYFQAQAIIGLTGVHVPPIVRSWTQDFQWSMGIIKVNWMQSIFTWYQRATGGTPSTIFNSLKTISVQVEKVKRSLPSPIVDASFDLFKRAAAIVPKTEFITLSKRANIEQSDGSYIVYGIQRVAYMAGIESTNLFTTVLTFFCVFLVLTIMGVAVFKGFCELAVQKKWMQNDKFLEFRNGWSIVLKGILFRMILIGFPQLTIFCLWEFTQKDSVPKVVLAVVFFFGMLATLGWAASKVVRIARRSVATYHNPAYILFSNPHVLNKWGFLYVQFRASAYYFILPMLGYIVVKGAFVAFGQRSGTAQAIAFVLIEAGALIAASVLKPWMDKSTNTLNIAICVINFLNAIFLLILSEVFDQPPLVTGVVGVVLFVVNAAFSLVLLIVIIVTTTIVFFRKNPDNRYQFMADDRSSFMKSQTQLTTTAQLDALAATARGDKAGYKPSLEFDDETGSMSSDSKHRRTKQPDITDLPPFDVYQSRSHSPAVTGYPYIESHRESPR